MINRICVVFSTFFGVGYAPGAPGTAGTLGAVGVVYLLHLAGGAVFYSAFTLGLILVSFIAAGRCVPIFKREDPPEVVIDEVCGFLVCMLFVPLNPVNLALGFFPVQVFRYSEAVSDTESREAPRGLRYRDG